MFYDQLLGACHTLISYHAITLLIAILYPSIVYYDQLLGACHTLMISDHDIIVALGDEKVFLVSYEKYGTLSIYYNMANKGHVKCIQK